MKKAALKLTAALLIFLSFGSVPPVNIRNATAVNARADSAVTYIYIRTDTPLSSASGESICILPATYFAVAEGSERDGKYPVSYLDLRGYLSVSDCETVDYEPVTKFAVRSATPSNDGMAVNLRSAPDPKTGSVICSVPPSATLTLYGPRTGGELFAGAGTLWQYVRYDDGTNAKYGYIYSPQLSLSPLSPNVIEKVERQEPQHDVTESGGSFEFTRTGEIVLAAALCVPAGIIMLVLFYRPDSKRIPRHSREQH